MKETELPVARWEIDSLSRQLDGHLNRVEYLEKRVTQLYDDRFRRTMFLMVAAYVAVVAGLVVLAALS